MLPRSPCPGCIARASDALKNWPGLPDHPTELGSRLIRANNDSSKRQHPSERVIMEASMSALARKSTQLAGCVLWLTWPMGSTAIQGRGEFAVGGAILSLRSPSGDLSRSPKSVRRFLITMTLKSMLWIVSHIFMCDCRSESLNFCRPVHKKKSELMYSTDCSSFSLWLQDASTMHSKHNPLDIIRNTHDPLSALLQWYADPHYI